MSSLGQLVAARAVASIPESRAVVIAREKEIVPVLHGVPQFDPLLGAVPLEVAALRASGREGGATPLGRGGSLEFLAFFVAEAGPFCAL